MSVTRLTEKRVEKVWGRRDLPDMFGGAYEGAEPLGEIWFELPGGSDAELLVKYLFTSEKLSIQVHPDEEAARRAGQTRGKDEAWIVLSSEAGATIGLGLQHRVTPEDLRQSALDGSIEALVDWRPAAAGDILYSPAGTVHAIGPGLMLIEVQQNTDVTYRLYDYGRPRELHLDEGVAVAEPGPYSPPMRPYVRADGREILAEGRAFVLERWRGLVAGTLAASGERPVWLVPVAGTGSFDGDALEPGGVWHSDEPAALTLDADAELFLAYPGAAVHDLLIA